MLKGLMQDRPLLISSLIEHAARLHPHAEIVSRTTEGPMHRCTYADIQRRSKQLANALTCSRRRARGANRHACLERLPPHGAVLRGIGDGGGACTPSIRACFRSRSSTS